MAGDDRQCSSERPGRGDLRPAVHYVSYQVKGRATVVPASDAHRERAARYVEAMTAILVGNGLDARVTTPWLVDREPAALRLGAEMIFVQTPGDKAGRRLEASR